MKRDNLLKLSSITGLIIIGALSRFIPHPPNFTPIGAIALFGGTKYNSKLLAFIIPLLIMFLSDLIIGFHTEIFAVYLSFIITVGIGLIIRKNIKTYKIIIAVIISSLAFFLITNFSCWLFSGLYQHTIDGLIICYWNAIPFFRNELLGSAVYNLFFFGSYALFCRFLPQLKEATYSI